MTTPLFFFVFSISLNLDSTLLLLCEGSPLGGFLYPPPTPSHMVRRRWVGLLVVCFNHHPRIDTSDDLKLRYFLFINDISTLLSYPSSLYTAIRWLATAHHRQHHTTGCPLRPLVSTAATATTTSARFTEAASLDMGVLSHNTVRIFNRV